MQCQSGITCYGGVIVFNQCYIGTIYESVTTSVQSHKFVRIFIKCPSNENILVVYYIHVFSAFNGV